MPGIQTVFQVETDNGTTIDLPAVLLYHPADLHLDATTDELHGLSQENKDPTEGNPIHPEYPQWMKTSHRMSYYHGKQRLLDRLELAENFQWAFIQLGNHGHRATEIILPDLVINWRMRVESGILDVGHTAATHSPIDTVRVDAPS